MVSSQLKQQAVASCHSSQDKLNLDWEYNHQRGIAGMVRSQNQTRSVFPLENRKSTDRNGNCFQLFERPPSNRREAHVLDYFKRKSQDL